LHSMTKFMGGQGTTLGGMIVDSGKFPWRDHSERFYMLNRPEPAYHGVVYVEHYGDAAYVARCRTVAQRNTGATLSPFNGFLLLQGVDTLALRVERHVDKARKMPQCGYRAHRRYYCRSRSGVGRGRMSMSNSSLIIGWGGGFSCHWF